MVEDLDKEVGKLVSFIVASKYRTKILLELKKSPKTTSMMAKILSCSNEQISRTLKELHKKGLVELLDPNARKGRLYILTKKGEQILKHPSIS